jgi:hypothetical protein
VQILGEFTRLSKGKKMHLTLLSKATAATIASQVKYVSLVTSNCRIHNTDTS